MISGAKWDHWCVPRLLGHRLLSAWLLRWWCGAVPSRVSDAQAAYACRMGRWRGAPAPPSPAALLRARGRRRAGQERRPNSYQPGPAPSPARLAPACREIRHPRVGGGTHLSPLSSLRTENQRPHAAGPVRCRELSQRTASVRTPGTPPGRGRKGQGRRATAVSAGVTQRRATGSERKPIRRERSEHSERSESVDELVG